MKLSENSSQRTVLREQFSEKLFVMKKSYLIIFIIAVLVVVGGVYYFGYQKGYKAGVETGRAAAQVKAGEVVTNPLEKMPETNPFEGVINPFKELYKNPFK